MEKQIRKHWARERLKGEHKAHLSFYILLRNVQGLNFPNKYQSIKYLIISQAFVFMLHESGTIRL